MKKTVLFLCIMGMALFFMAGCSDSAQTGRQNKNASAEEGNAETSEDESAKLLENAVGTSTEISIENAFYYDLLEDNAGDIFTFAKNTMPGVSEDAPVIAWKSSDRGDTWEEALYQPEALQDGSEIQAGALRIGEGGIEAFAVFSEHSGESMDGNTSRLFRIKENTCEELEATDALQQLGGMVWNISFVNEHVISLAAGEQCILYDIEQQKAVKSLSYDMFTVGFLSMPEQFIVYGKEIVHCLDAESLEEQEADKSLQEFVAAMFEKNGDTVFPPMDAYKDAVICVTAEAVYEYREGETIRTLSVPRMMNGGNFLNGIFPVCRGKDNTYYASGTSTGTSMLWRIEEDTEAEKDIFTIYSLEKNEGISQIVLLFQQEHPELNVELRLGIEDEAALTRTDAIKQLNTELMAGGGADILIMDGLSVEKYADMGLLHPIELERPEGKYFTNVIETYQKNGALYAAPIGFWLYAVQGSKDLASEIADPAGLSQWILSNVDKTGLKGYEYTEDYNAYSQYTQFLYDAYANSIVKDGTADRNALEAYMDICGKMAETSAQSLSEEDYITSSILSGAIEVHYNDEVEISAGMVISEMDLAALMEEQKNETAEYSLYPMYQPRDIIAVNANTEHSDIAQEFVEFSLSDSAQKVSKNFFHSVVLENFRGAAQKEGADADHGNLVAEIVLGEDEESFEIYRPAAEDLDSLEQEIKEIDTVFTDDFVLRNIVMEELESYLSGSTGLEDAVSSAENRINLYLGE